MSVNRSVPRRALVAVVAAATVTGLTVLGAPGGASAGTSGTESTYVVLYAAGASSAGAAGAVGAAGGTVVANYTQIGVVVARSTSTGFAATMKNTAGVQGVSATQGFATRLTDETAGAGDVSPASDPPDSLASLQWDMAQIHAPEAQAVNAGSPTVTVGDIDTGLDFTHPDLAANVDFTNSVSCIGGVPDTSPAAWMDDNGHGTHTAGTIAAAKNGVGITGVAPNVKIAGIKAGNADGYFFPEAVICAFMWVGSHHIPVTNNSYFADPWLFNCKNDPDQRAIWEAERRAVRFAQSKGDLVVSAEGNQADDLSHPTQDSTSPDDTTPVVRDVTNACAVVPVELPGVVGVTATGNKHMKSFYSSYGISTADLAAPGGDTVLQLTSAAPNGRVLSTWPASVFLTRCLPARRLVDPATGATYCYQQGTSMASPHVAGVAALVASVRPGATAGAIASRLQSSA
ncbi:MAG TPA: S8 family serine peptidase, partial [Actinomycetes bacterium]